MSPLLSVRDLSVRLPNDGRHVPVLRSVSLDVARGEALGLVGESGSGKSMTVKAVDRLLPGGAQIDGTVSFDGADVYQLKKQALRKYREDVAMIFQDPRAHINPVRRIGDFMTEAVVAHGSMTLKAARARAVELLDAARVDRGAERLDQYPHELSGGLLQRVMIASALMGSPRLLLADEPTTALDVTTQADVMAIIDELRHEFDLAMIFITHDLELAAAVCDRTAVMYAGQILEENESAQIEHDPTHPYTAALLSARPRVDRTLPRLEAIPGQPVSAFGAPTDGCAFSDRCVHAIDICRSTPPPTIEMPSGLSRCHRAEELRGNDHDTDQKTPHG
jgi:oligopeptide/dipeptide ABC transporter ATP-binding protein